MSRRPVAVAVAALLVGVSAGCSAGTGHTRHHPTGSQLHTTVSSQDIVDGFSKPEMFCHESLARFTREYGSHTSDYPTAATVYYELQERC